MKLELLARLLTSKNNILSFTLMTFYGQVIDTLSSFVILVALMTIYKDSTGVPIKLEMTQGRYCKKFEHQSIFTVTTLSYLIISCQVTEHSLLMFLRLYGEGFNSTFVSFGLLIV